MSKVDSSKERDDFALLDLKNRDLTLFLVSVLGLFLELMLIRWIGTEIRIFAYLQNTVLVVCFMGLGMGCLTSRKPIVFREMIWPLIVLTLLIAIPPSRWALSRISELLSVLGDFLIWSQGVSRNPALTVLAIVQGLVLTLVLMILIWDCFVPLGRMVGRLLDDHPKTIWAYSVNVAGGLVGIWLFVLLSALQQPPWVWFAVTAVLTLALIVPRNLHQRRVRIDAALMGLLVVLAWIAGRRWGSIELHWSPYQKLVLMPPSNAGDERLDQLGKYVVTVNNAGYQAMIDLNPEHVAADPVHFPEEMRGLSQYDIPFVVHPRPQRALIVGAGSGNDAAGALRNGVSSVTAVEIDPAIISMGRRYHPERPYDSPRVTLVNDDARAYFETCQERFDVISFGLLDSHTTTAMTNARLDHYVYTRESLQRARRLLADGGIITLSFEAQKPFIADRMARVLREVFDQEPISFRIPQNYYGWGGAMFIVGDLDAARRQLAANPRLAGLIQKWQQEDPVELAGTTPVITDDWPYVYLKSPSIPVLYFLLAGLLAILFARGVRRLQLKSVITSWDRPAWHFFFLGAAFLLLEVQSISRASVVLGNTWFVNAVIISGILAMVLLANLIVARCPRLPDAPVYVTLFLVCLALGFIDLSRFGALPTAARALLVGGLTSLPMLCSGVIFGRSFARTAHKDQALGTNLFGALVGGLLQSATFLVGVRALLLIVAGLYFAAYLTRQRTTAQTEPSPMSLFRRTKSGTEKTAINS